MAGKTIVLSEDEIALALLEYAINHHRFSKEDRKYERADVRMKVVDKILIAFVTPTNDQKG